jgi:DNA-binding transcriptional regulator YdaS (Cro superfamily)
MLSIVETAAERVGGIVRLARKLGVKHPAFYSWRRVPAVRVQALADITGVPPHEIRPDVFYPPKRRRG